MSRNRLIVAAVMVIVAGAAVFIVLRTGHGGRVPSRSTHETAPGEAAVGPQSAEASGGEGTSRTGFADLFARIHGSSTDESSGAETPSERMVVAAGGEGSQATSRPGAVPSGIPDMGYFSEAFAVEKIPGSDPEVEAPLVFTNRADELEYYGRLVEVMDEKVSNYEAAIAEFRKRGDEKSVEYYLGLLTSARESKALHEASLRSASQRAE